MQGDLLAFGERQVAARQRKHNDWCHPATLTEPVRPDGRRHAGSGASLLARQPPGDLFPEPPLVLTPPNRRTAR